MNTYFLDYHGMLEIAGIGIHFRMHSKVPSKVLYAPFSKGMYKFFWEDGSFFNMKKQKLG